jgi:hypothetical protein
VLWVLLIIFILGTPLLIGYSMGYRLNDALGLIQTGGIYLHSDMSNTLVFLDDEFVENNGALLRNTLVQDLLPNRYYNIRAQRDGYQSWVKVLRVEPNLVTEARVMMLPTEFDWILVPATTTIELTPSTTEAIDVATTSNERMVPNPEYEALTAFFDDDQAQFEIDVATSAYEFIRGKRYPTTTIVEVIQFPEWLVPVASSTHLAEKDMVREREGIVTWLENGDIFVIWARSEDPQPYYFCETKQLCKEQLSINWGEEIIRYEFYPNRSDAVVVLSERGLYAVELDNRSQRNIQVILEEPGLDFRLQGDGTLIVFDGESYRITNW